MNRPTLARAATACGLFLAASALAPAPTPASARGSEPTSDLSPFARVRTILAGKCLACHDGETRKGGLDLTRHALAVAGGESGPAVVPGDPVESLLLEKVADGEMPPKNPLEPEQVEALRAWIAAGAPYEVEPLAPAIRKAGPDWWSLRPIGRPEVPPAREPALVRNPVDAFLQAALDAKGIAPAPEADRRTLIRRLAFDLTGLPPTPEEVDAFVADPAANAYEALVDRLLASPRYGERWGRHWLDVARFAESHGYETNALRPNAWPYRDYVIRAFNDDTPLPRFILEQLAGDALPDGDWLTRSATGFLVGGGHDIVTNQTVEGMKQQRADDLDDMITAAGTAFLGLTVNCARCHDHKFDPIAQRDYYALQAVFAGVNYAEREVEHADSEARRAEARRIEAELARLDLARDAFEPEADPEASTPRRSAAAPGRNVDRFPATPARFVRFTVEATSDGERPCLDELEVYAAGPDPANLALASAGGKPTASSTLPGHAIHRVDHLVDGRYGNGRSWISDEPGKGVAEVELAGPAVIDRVVWGRDREGKFRDRLPVVYRIEVAEQPGQWRTVARSTDRAPAGSTPTAADGPEPPELAAIAAEQESLRKRLAELAPTRKVYAGTFTQPGPTHRLERGDPLRPAEPVAPGAIGAIRPPLTIEPDAPEADRRLALARWLGDPANPLPARVMVNRAWHYHFGRGLLATPGDFGLQGGTPSHPELLDWLARAYIDGGFRLKPIHRLIVTSAAYRRSGRPDPAAQAVDAGNVLLWRFPPRRLEAEAIRDAILAATGELDLTMGGPGYWIWEENTNYVVVFRPRPELGADTFRRMVYQYKPRSQHDPTFGAFDCPDSALVAPRRNVSTTALQALNLLNSPFLVARSEALGRRLGREAGPDPEAQARLGFRLAFGRLPTEAEQAGAAALIRDHGPAALARALFNASEFLYAP